MNKKIATTLTIIIFLAVAMATTSFNKLMILNDYVYVCGKSNIYHPSKTHSALKRCKADITKITLSKAKGQGKKKCKCRN